MNEKHYWVYILKCSNGAYYTGYTTDLKRRYREHLSGSLKCKYTRSFKPLKIARSWYVGCDRSIAMKIEKWIKRMKRKDKENLMLSENEIDSSYKQANKLNTDLVDWLM